MSLGLQYDLNAYVGHSVAAIDLNGSGCRSALLVGAYGYEGEEGAIIATKFSDDGVHLLDRALISRDTPESFADDGAMQALVTLSYNWGASLESLGDLDEDGQQDLLVGAHKTLHYVPWLNTPGELTRDGGLFLASISSELLVTRLVRIGSFVEELNGLFPHGILPYRMGITATSISAADLDGDGLLEVAVGIESYEVPFDARRRQDQYQSEHLPNARQGGVILFTLGLGPHMNESSPATVSIRRRLGGSNAALDRALVVPGTLRLMHVPMDYLKRKSRAGRGAAIVAGPFTDPSIPKEPLLMLGVPGVGPDFRRVGTGLLYSLPMPAQLPQGVVFDASRGLYWAGNATTTDNPSHHVSEIRVADDAVFGYERQLVDVQAMAGVRPGHSSAHHFNVPAEVRVVSPIGAVPRPDLIQLIASGATTMHRNGTRFGFRRVTTHFMRPRGVAKAS